MKVMVEVLSYTIRIISIDEKVELIELIIKIVKHDVAILAAYRPPNTENINQFMDVLDKRVKALDNKVFEVIIMGDLNFNMFDDNNPLIDFNSTHGFNNTISQGTRLNKQTNKSTLIDVILVYSLLNFVASLVFPFAFSNHNLVVSIFNFKKLHNKASHVEKRCFSEENISNLKRSIKSILSTFEYEQEDINQHWSLLKNVIVSCLNNNLPFKKIQIKTKKKIPWINKHTVCLGKITNSAYHKALRNKEDKKAWNKYKAYRNKYQSSFRKSKINYYNNLITKLASSAKKLWNRIKPFVTPNSKSSIIP